MTMCAAEKEIKEKYREIFCKLQKYYPKNVVAKRGVISKVPFYRFMSGELDNMSVPKCIEVLEEYKVVTREIEEILKG